MPALKIAPYAGLNKRFPQHKIVNTSKKGESQFCVELKNLLCLDSKIYKFPGARRYNDTAVSGDVRWSKRIYYTDGGDKKRYQFSVIGNKMYRGNDNTGELSQSLISTSTDISIEDSYPIDSTLKVAGVVSTFLVDGKYFYKFNGNEAGSWDRLEIKQDVDGNDIEPIFIAEYLDRMWVLCKNRNVLIGSKNLNPESFDDSTDSVLIELPPGNGGYPTGLIVHRGFLFILHEDYFVPLSGSSPATFGVKPGDVVVGYGTRAPRSIVSLKTKFAFLNSFDNEWYMSNGTVDSTEKTPFSYPINFSKLINPTRAYLTVACHDEKLNAIRASYVYTGEYYLNAEVIYSLDEEKWCGETRGRKISTYSPWNGNGDQGEILTGRSDTGVLMVESVNELNFDSSAIPMKLVTASYTASEMGTVQFENFFLEGKPSGNYSVPFTYYLDTRLTTNGVENFNMQGELIGSFAAQFADQLTFMNEGRFLIDKNRGRMVRFEMEWEPLDRYLEFYSLYATYNVMEDVFSKYIHGA